MSIIRCYDCDRSIDTDFLPSETLETKYGDIELCEDCAMKREEIADREARMKAACTCTEWTVHPTDLEPPEGKKRDKYCPIHGIDPDDARDAQQDRCIQQMENQE